MERITLFSLQRGRRFAAAALLVAFTCVDPPASSASQNVADRSLSSASGESQSAAWVELTGAGAVVRANITQPHCPVLSVDDRPLPMEIRARPTPTFPETLCQATLPLHALKVELAGRPLPAPKTRIDRIVVMGDTGCRIRGLAVQNCNDPQAWPFAEVSRRAAAEKPDLVIHVGDYYYRETACPLNWSGCEASPHGDAWPTWAAEFFEPARPLLAAAPWVFARGNHELCARGGQGWFRLLDAGWTPRSCPARAAPFSVPLGGVSLRVIDGSDAEDRSAPPGAVAAFRADLQSFPAGPGQPAWILTHRPIWGRVPLARIGPIGPLNININETEQAAARGAPLDGVDLVLSGHIHHFASFSFGPPRPAQLIVGTGGDQGEAADLERARSELPEIDGLRAKSLEFEEFGYFVLERAGSDWRGVFKSVDGRVRAHCLLKGRDLACEKGV